MSDQICKIFPNFFYTSNTSCNFKQSFTVHRMLIISYLMFLVSPNLVLAWSSRPKMVTVPNFVLYFGWLWQGFYHEPMTMPSWRFNLICLSEYDVGYHTCFFTVRLGWICERPGAHLFNLLSDRPRLLCNLKR